MIRRSLAAVLVVASALVQAQEWALPGDRETFSREAQKLLLARDDYPATTAFTKRVEYIDFESFGQSFTQVVVILAPATPRRHNGRDLVVVGAEPGSEYAGDFLETPEGREGPGVWLARRGVT